MFFIPVLAIPPNKKATYLCIVFAHCPEKEVPHCVQWTMGGDHVEYNSNISTKTADIVMTKLLFNSMVSTPNGCCMIGDLKDFYLSTPMQPWDYVYMQILVDVLPLDIMNHYQLHNLVAKSMWKYSVACTDYHRLDGWPTPSFKQS